MEPIGIFILAMLCQVYSCASNVSDSVERIQYASVAGEEYLQEDKLETDLDDKVYFDFDKSTLDAEDKNLLEQYLPEIKKARIVRLEGHCDERGTREYNLALGERRALEVRDFLVVKGVSGKKIRVVSFGEEKPLKSASNEKAWAENRRVEISLY
jgi:peptidoglycan-associated lipoprotein|tara:strand:- start:45 stop:509 length:465 start_codon:yes stop_codon:yes gene_type:complete